MGSKSLAAAAVRPGSLEWRVPRKAGGTAVDADIHRAAMDLGPGSKTLIQALKTDTERTIEELKTHLADASGPATVGIPATWALLRVIDLPSGTPDELRGMVDLQVDKFSPFPLEASVVSYEMLAENEGRTKVLISAIPGETAETLGAAFRTAGVAIKRVDVNLMGWWRLLKDADKVHQAGSQAFLILDQKDCDIIVTLAGVPVAVRAISGLDDLPDEEMADEIVRETVHTLTALDLGYGGESPTEVSVWHPGEQPPAAILRNFAEQQGIAAKSCSLDALPPLCEGLARRAETAAGLLDLVPPAWKQAEIAHRTRLRILSASLGVLGAWALFMIVLFGGLQIEKKRLSSLETKLQELKTPADKARAIRDRAISLRQYMDRSRSALECLREVSDLLPPGIEIKSMSYNKGKSLELSGEADAASLVFDFKKEMEKSSLFASTELPRMMVTREGKHSFKIIATFPGAKP